MGATDAIAKLTEETLAEKKAELENKAGPLAAEVKELEAALKKITKGSGSTSANGPAVAENDLIEAVVHCSKSGPASSKEIAKFLGTDTRNIARRLSAFAQEGKISGDKDDGYTAA